MPGEEARLTPEDIADLNRSAVARSAALLRIGGTAAIVLGVFGTVAWAWFEVRTQQNVSGSVFDFNANQATVTGPNFAERIDLLANSLSLLVMAALAAIAGLAARHLSDYTQARTGSSVTGFVVGDLLEVEDEQD